MMNTGFFRWCLGILLLSLSACVNLEPKPDPTRFYILGEGGAQEDSLSINGHADFRMIVQLAGFLDDVQMVERLGDHEIVYRSYHRWAEHLREGIARILREALAVSKEPLDLELLFEDFSYHSGSNEVVCDVVLTRFVGQMEIRERIVLRAEVRGTEVADQVAALTALLEQLTVAIASK